MYIRTQRALAVGVSGTRLPTYGYYTTYEKIKTSRTFVLKEIDNHEKRKYEN